MSEYYRGGFLEDTWVYINDDAPVPETGNVIVSLTRWRAGGACFSDLQGQVGVFVEPDDVFHEHTDRLSKLSLVSLSFPKFSDGRGYSQARMLREQLGFEGEIRGRGEILLDQIPLMMRCGIDAFEVCHEPTIAALKSEALPGIMHTYQSPVNDRFGRLRRWRGQIQG